LTLLNIKILLAPVLAIVLALFLAGAINSSMLPTTSDVNIQPTPRPSIGSTLPPMPQPSMSAPNSPFLFIAGAVLVGIIAVLLFFREKSLTKIPNE
jgi:hypothetical protein